MLRVNAPFLERLLGFEFDDRNLLAVGRDESLMQDVWPGIFRASSLMRPAIESYSSCAPGFIRFRNTVTIMGSLPCFLATPSPQSATPSMIMKSVSAYFWRMVLAL